MRIAGIGDNVIDRYLNKGVMYPGGNAVNVAAHSAMLGADSAYIGVIGDDLGGSIIAKEPPEEVKKIESKPWLQTSSAMRSISAL